MDDLSLYLLDIVQNSFKAEANLLSITIDENTRKNLMTLTIQDNGYGMSEAQALQSISPFYTTRTTRKVGLGLPFLKMAANLADGDLTIASIEGIGTTVSITFVLNHVNTPPLGDIGETLYTILIHPQLKELKYIHTCDDREFTLELGTIMTLLDGVPLTELTIMKYLKSYINDNVELIRRQL